MRDGVEQARASGIMRLPQPHDRDGRPCLPTHHPRSQPPSPSSPTPTRPGQPKSRTCSPTSPRSVTHEGPSGRRHPLVAILAMAAAAVLTGARSITAIAEWAADSPQPVRAALGARRDAPDRWVVPAEATIRRTLARVDSDLLAAVIGAWLADRDRPGQRRRAVAVDGKTLRGARPRRPAGPSARRDGPHHPRRARPMPGQRRPRRSPRVPAAAARPGPDRHRGHGRCAAHPRRRRRVPGHPQVRSLLVHGQGQPAHPAGPLRPPALAAGSRPGPHPRPRATAASSCAPSRPSRSAGSDSRTPPRSSRSPAGSAACAVGDGRR